MSINTNRSPRLDLTLGLVNIGVNWHSKTVLSFSSSSLYSEYLSYVPFMWSRSSSGSFSKTTGTKYDWGRNGSYSLSSAARVRVESMTPATKAWKILSEYRLLQQKSVWNKRAPVLYGKHYIMSMASFPDYVCLGTRPISQVQRRLRGGRTQNIKSWSWSRKACWYFFMTHRSLSQLDPQGTLNWIHSRKHWF